MRWNSKIHFNVTYQDVRCESLFETQNVPWIRDALVHVVPYSTVGSIPLGYLTLVPLGKIILTRIPNGLILCSKKALSRGTEYKATIQGSTKGSVCVGNI